MSNFRPGDEATLVASPMGGSPNIGRRVLIVGYANYQPTNERVYLCVGIGDELIGACGHPVHVPASHLSADPEQPAA